MTTGGQAKNVQTYALSVTVHSMYTRDVSPYSRLNDTLNDIIFDGRFCDVPVYIDVEGDLKLEICEKLGLEEAELSEYVGEVVADTLLWDGSVDIYDWHCSSMLSWRLERDKPPPFTALLLALSIAAENMGAGEDLSSINFYGRVSQIFGDASYKDQISKYSKTTVLFWKDLNSWLIENDYFYGRPTARPILSNWKYASYALSQALVRRSDRDCFHKLFEEYNLSKSDQLSYSELEPYISEWIKGPSPTILLKKLWKTSNLRQRIVEAALEELGNWNGRSATTGQKLPGRLLWVLRFQSFPMKKAQLKLCAASDDIAEDYSLYSKDFRSLDLKLVAQSLNLRHFDGQDLSFLAPTPMSSLNLEELILSELILEKENRESFARKYRSIIPLIRQENGHFFKEVSQTLLFHEYQILCASSWKEKIITFLDIYAAPDYQVMDYSSNNGLPAGWCLFLAVEIVKVPKEADIHDDLYALIPSERGLALYPAGGLKLSGAGDVWHKWAPPNIFAVNNGVPLGIKVSSVDSNTSRCLISVDNSVEQPDFLYKDGRSILTEEPTNELSFRTTGENPKSKQIEKTYSFRSANSPKKHPLNTEWQLQYSFSQPEDKCEWISANEHKSSSFLMGLDTSALEEIELVRSSVGYGEKLFVGNESIQYADVADDVVYEPNHGFTNTAICVQRGVHAWLMPMGVTTKTKRANQQCADCGARGIFMGKKASWKIKPTKKTTVATNRNVGELSQTEIVRFDKKLQPKRIFKSITHDIILDALSYRGGGSGYLLYKWFALLVDESWKVTGLIKNYVNLGFIDINIDPDSYRIKQWSVAPATFVINDEGIGFLTGFRSELLSDTVSSVLNKFDVSTNIQNCVHQPTRYEWIIEHNIRHDVISELSKLKPSFKLVIVENPGTKILPYMPRLESIIENCKSVTPQLRDLEKFDVPTASWCDWSDVLSVGAYRHKNYPRRHFYVNNDSSSRLMSHEVAKIAAANYEGVRLQDYDVLSKEFSCALGCGLPGLYERILISCSGVLPEKVDGKIMVYKNVPMEVGQGILERMYG
tara:strand:+ start:94 stop:3240 length:3147 start_codon:yes stop_codon:yes gene_type:complete